MDLCDKFITSHVYVLSKHQQGKCAVCFGPHSPVPRQNSSAGSERLWISSTALYGKLVLFSVYSLTKHWQVQK